MKLVCDDGSAVELGTGSGLSAGPNGKGITCHGHPARLRLVVMFGPDSLADHEPAKAALLASASGGSCVHADGIAQVGRTLAEIRGELHQRNSRDADRLVRIGFLAGTLQGYLEAAGLLAASQATDATEGE